MSNYFYFDLETIGVQNPDHIKYIEENLRDPKKVLSKSALNGTRGEIYCITYGVNNRPVRNVSRGELIDGSFERTEAELIDEFCKTLSHPRFQSLDPVWVAHNIDFDLRFLWQRLAVHRRRERRIVPINEKPWSVKLFDTMKQWGGFKGYVTLHELAVVLGMEINDPIKGDDVWKELEKGNSASVIHHCNRDVELLRDIHTELFL